MSGDYGILTAFLADILELVPNVHQRVSYTSFVIHAYPINGVTIRDSSVGITTGYGLGGHVSSPGRSKRFFSTPQRPDWLWGPPSLLSNGYRLG
jgi:hypothetical protein